MSSIQTVQIKKLVESLLLAKGDPATADWGRAVFLIGAGCSLSAGIPMADGIAKLAVRKLARIFSQGKAIFEEPEAALAWLCDRQHLDEKWKKNTNWGKLYGEIFEDQFRSDGRQREIILESINKSGGKINWAHLCLGELVNRGFVHTVLTTNFDQLVLKGIINTGVLPVTADGIESLSRVISHPKTPQVVHLHGSMHTYSLRNSKTSVRETDQETSFVGMIHNILQECDPLVVVGYAGGEEGVMTLLREAVKKFPNLVIFWALYDEDIEKLSPAAEDLLKAGHNKFVITSCDADKFFTEIMEGLEIGIPDWMRNPTKTLLNQAASFAPTDNDDIKIKIRDYQENIESLDAIWEERIKEKPDTLTHISSLRLEGRLEEAFDLIKDFPKINYKDWQLQAETAYEAGQKSSKLEYLEESMRAWEEATNAAEIVDQQYEALLGLAKTLHFLSELDSQIGYIEQAVEAYRKALAIQEFKIQNRHAWAKTQNELGIELLELYRQKKDSSLIEEAINAHETAAQIFGEEKEHKRWAETQTNLGGALQKLAEISDNIELMNRAAKAFEGALRVYTRERYAKDWAETQTNLGGVLQKLGEIQNDVALLERAGKAFSNALGEYTPLQDENWLWTMTNLGIVLRKIGEIKQDIPTLDEAVGTFVEIIAQYDFDIHPDEEPFDTIERELIEIRLKIEELKSKTQKASD